jgi:glycosyltransferase involved in cell wall biosynthesis
VEVVVVDDGGSDGTAEAVRASGADVVRVIRHDRSRGVSAARNAGLASATTPWVAFVDDDDIWAPDKLRHQVAAVRSSGGARWSCVGTVVVDAQVQVLHQAEPPASGDVAPRLLTQQVIPGGGSGVLVETHLAREVGGFDENISIVADWDFYLRLSLRSAMASVNEPLLGYYVHQDSMLHDPLGCVRELDYMERKYEVHPEGAGFRFDRAWFTHLARMAYRLGDRSAARSLLWQGLRTAGPAPPLRLAAGKLRERLDRLLTGPPTPPFDDAQLRWLDRYRGGAEGDLVGDTRGSRRSARPPH